jgi:phospholipid/cholesterol/gamma-HCH transport system substrate-binding protein
MTPRRRNLITGAVVLGALATLTWMILTFSGRMMGIFKSPGTRVEFKSDRADGLSDGSPVLYAGVPVGKVTRVRRLSDNMHLEIEGEIDNNPPLPKNLIGEIRSQSALGSSSMVSLELKGAPKGILSEGDSIPLRYAGGILPPELTDFVAQVKRQELIKHVDSAVVSLQTQVEKVGKVMDSLQGLVGDPKMQDDLRQTIINIRQVSDRATKIGAKLETLTDNANTTLTDVRSTVDDAHKMVNRTDKNLDELSHQLGYNLDKLGQTFVQFQQVAEKINKGHGTAGALINDPKLYDELTTTAKELNVVAASLQRLVDQWEHEGVSVNLGKK